MSLFLLWLIFIIRYLIRQIDHLSNKIKLVRCYRDSFISNNRNVPIYITLICSFVETIKKELITRKLKISLTMYSINRFNDYFNQNYNILNDIQLSPQNILSTQHESKKSNMDNCLQYIKEKIYSGQNKFSSYELRKSLPKNFVLIK